MTIRWPLLVRRTHKWLALVVGVQVMLWAATGFYMVVVHLDMIHGDHLVRPVTAPALDLARAVPPGRIVAAYPDIDEFRLMRLRDRPVWRASRAGRTIAFDAVSGEELPPMLRREAVAVAKAIYAGSSDVVAARLLTVAPLETQSRKPPYWQVEFAGWNLPTLYLSPTTGELVAKRHLLWRVFDFAWMLHIMDYDTRSQPPADHLRRVRHPVAGGHRFLPAVQELPKVGLPLASAAGLTLWNVEREISYSIVMPDLFRHPPWSKGECRP